MGRPSLSLAGRYRASENAEGRRAGRRRISAAERRIPVYNRGLRSRQYHRRPVRTVGGGCVAQSKNRPALNLCGFKFL
jgi:hypothetical protein